MKALMTTGLLLVLALALYLAWQESDETDITSEFPVASVDAQMTRLDVGLGAEGQADWHHLDEGSGFIPLSFFYALKDAQTGQAFIEILPRFGLVPDPENPLGLPIGFTAAKLFTAPNNSLYAGVNCAACHSGQYNYQGHELVIDGAPNLLNFEGLLDALVASVTQTVESPKALMEMIHALGQWERKLDQSSELLALHPDARQLFSDIVGADDSHSLAPVKQEMQQGLHEAYHSPPEARKEKLRQLSASLSSATFSDRAEKEGMLGRLQEDLLKFERDMRFIHSHAERLITLNKSFKGQTVAGPGRADSFDAIWDLLVQKDQMMAMTAPVSIPQLFDYAHFKWVHWDGNTTAVAERDYAQAIALGADFDPTTGDSAVLPSSVIQLELTAHQFTAPQWPEDILGAIDQQKTARGGELFDRHCAVCHTTETLTLVEVVGTDPNRAMNFAQLQQDDKSYAQLLTELGTKVVDVSLAKHNMSRADLVPVEHSDSLEWRITNAYHSRALKGIWASAPYLHNGSVPSLRDLLRPAAERPKEFQVGRELDPANVGIDSLNQPDGGWTFKVAENGNSNQGHEYGVDLNNAEKDDLIEFLKTL